RLVLVNWLTWPLAKEGRASLPGSERGPRGRVGALGSGLEARARCARVFCYPLSLDHCPSVSSRRASRLSPSAVRRSLCLGSGRGLERATARADLLPPNPYPPSSYRLRPLPLCLLGRCSSPSAPGSRR